MNAGNVGNAGNDEQELSRGGEADLHRVQGVQHYVRQVGKVAEALARDDELTKRVIDAVHRGSSSAVEKLFSDLGVESAVTITTVDGPADTDGTGGTIARSNTGASAGKTKTITISIGIGPFSVSVTVKKDSK
jgi:hypothetical protein